MLVILCNYFKHLFITAFVGSKYGQFKARDYCRRLFVRRVVQNLPRRQRGYIDRYIEIARDGADDVGSLHFVNSGNQGDMRV